MNIVFLAPANNYHTKKWCSWFYEHGHKVTVISLVPPDEEIVGVDIIFLNPGCDSQNSDLRKLKYLTQIFKVRSIIETINPDIVNAHYASSYGALAAFAGISGFILSIWGEDVYDFPKKSVFHKLFLKYVFYKAKRIFSTSKAMAIEAEKYTKKPLVITPFGVDLNLFSPGLRTRNDNDFVIGTIKTLSPKYGIGILLEAVALVRKKRSDIPLKVRIAGKGSHEMEYRQLAESLEINDCISWLGFISQKEAAVEWANFDCAIIPSESESESFGVSAVEAQACECPVIISDIPGLMEATDPGNTSFVVRRGNVDALAKKIIEVYMDIPKRKKMGKNGRLFVEKNYEINKCFRKIEREMNVI